LSLPWAALPVLIPLSTLLACVTARAHPAVQRTASYAGATAWLVAAAMLASVAGADAPAQMSFGGWDAPVAIRFRVDRLGAAMLLAAALAAMAMLLALDSDADAGDAHPLRLPLLHGLLTGVGGALATADLFNLYVWFELMLVALVGLLAIGGRLDQLDAAWKYLVLNTVATLVMLVAIAWTYAITGHLDYVEIARALPSVASGAVGVVLVVLVLALLAKSAAFPLFAWLPASYHTLPGPVLAFVGGVLTKVGVVVLLRVTGDVFAPTPAWLLEAIGWSAVASMLIGGLLAAYHWDLRRILAVHIVSQIGYVLLGLALGGVAGRAALLFYALHIVLVKTNLFLLAAIVRRLTGSYDLRRIGGLYAARPALAAAFAVSALALVGIPPLSGFWAKLGVLREALGAGRWAWTAAALTVSVLTLYSMMKVWMEAFWKPHPETPPDSARRRLAPAWAAVGLLTLAILAMSLHPQPFVEYAQAAAQHLGGQ
jgi:multicomponent Na+:H+ antiporter subunit D